MRDFNISDVGLKFVRPLSYSYKVKKERKITNPNNTKFSISRKVKEELDQSRVLTPVLLVPFKVPPPTPPPGTGASLKT